MQVNAEISRTYHLNYVPAYVICNKVSFAAKARKQDDLPTSF